MALPELRIGGNEASRRGAGHEIGFGGTFEMTFSIGAGVSKLEKRKRNYVF